MVRTWSKNLKGQIPWEKNVETWRDLKIGSTDPGNSVVVTREKGGGRVVQGKGGQINGDGRRLDLGGKHTMRNTDDIL